MRAGASGAFDGTSLSPRLRPAGRRREPFRAANRPCDGRIHALRMTFPFAHHRASGCAIFLAVLATLRPPARAADGAADVEFFEKKVRPVLVERCYECHSAGAKKLKGGLLLDTREGVLRGGDNGPALVPGEPDRSAIIKAVRYHDPDLQMPPKQKLPDAQIADLEAWVKTGAPDPRGAAPAAA